MIQFQNKGHTRANLDRIEVNPRVMMKKPVVKETRIPVDLILRKLGEGASEDDLLDAYPRLTLEDIRAVLMPHSIVKN